LLGRIVPPDATVAAGDAPVQVSSERVTQAGQRDKTAIKF
jgi:hypothetical protein